MKKMKNLVSMFLANALTLALFAAYPATALAANSTETVNLTGHAKFEDAVTAAVITPPLTDVTTLVITGQTTVGAWTTNDRDYLKTNFPNATTLDLSGYTGTFDGAAFQNCTSFTTVKLPANTALSDVMFNGCTGLNTLSVGTGLSTSGEIDLNGFTSTYGIGVFYGCTSVTTVKLPANVAISYQMFSDCTGLNTLSVGTGPSTSGVIDLNGFASTYDDYAFRRCTSVTTVKLPANVAISTEMFGYCTNLVTLAVGTGPSTSGVIDLNGFTSTYGDGAFGCCTSVTTVKLPAGVEISTGMFSVCTNLVTLAVGTGALTSGVIDLSGYTASAYGDNAFGGCTSITTVKLPAGTAIYDRMFLNCTSLNTVYLNGAAAPYIGISAFDYVPTTGTIYYPSGMTGVGAGSVSGDFGFGTNLASWTRTALSYCEITNTGVRYGMLADALTAVTDGQTIRLLQNISHTSQISISGKTVTLETNGFNLNVNTADDFGLYVDGGGKLLLDDTGGGEFNVTTSSTFIAAAGLWVDGAGSEGTVTNATATGTSGNGARANGGGSVAVRGNATGTSTGVNAQDTGSAVTVGGNAAATGTVGIVYGAYASNGASVAVLGNVTAARGEGVYAQGAGSAVTVSGNVNVSGTGAVGVRSGFSGGEITIGGAITVPAGETYILLTGIPKTTADYTEPPVPAKAGYRTYTDGTGTVWVKGTAPAISGGATSTTDAINLTEGYTSGNTKTYAIGGGDAIAPTAVSVTGISGATVTGAGLLTLPTGLTASGSPYTATVTASNGVSPAATMTVTVNVTALSSDKAITSFTLAGATASINEGAGTIAVTVPYGTNITALTPTIVHNGASIDLTGAQNFTTPVTYTVTAADASTKTYSVTVTVASLPPTPPAISGPARMTLPVGYAATSTETYTITGTGPVTVTKTSGDDRITWNSSTHRLDIAAGLAAGVYEVKLRASNSSSTLFTFTFTLTVEAPAYYIEPPVTTGGTVTIQSSNANPYLAEEGDVVTLTITPDAGYELTSITVYMTDGSGNVVGSVVIPLSGTGATRTFVMPAHPVAIVATFTVATGIVETGRAPSLQAWVQHGVLNVSGLTPGQPYSVYNITGAPVYQGEQPETVLPARGIYIITDGKVVIKVVN